MIACQYLAWSEEGRCAGCDVSNEGPNGVALLVLSATPKGGRERRLLLCHDCALDVEAKVRNLVST